VSDDRIHIPGDYRSPYYQQTPPPAAQTAQPERRGWSGGAVVAAATAGAVIGGILMAAAMLLLFGVPQLVGGGNPASPGQTQESRQSPASATSSPPVDAGDRDQPVESIAQAVTPSVVNIAVEQQVSDFFGRSGVQAGNGSGVIIRSDGYILTNNHVVRDASKITVKIGLEDVPAKIVGADSVSDIAVIKVDRKGLTAAVLGDSDNLKVGQEVVAIGSPFGLDKTVTSGIVSALHRSGLAGDPQSTTVYANLIQTDAAINPGNSGGALADMSGKVIGINTLIQTGGAQQSAGIGFAIPVKLAKQVADQLIATGKASHAFLGVAGITVDQQTAAQLGLKVTAGTLVQDIVTGSPADKAGMKRGDVILKIGDQAVQSSQDMIAAVRSHNPGDEVDVTIDRQGKAVTSAVTLGSAQ
jgi:S1-C subfamily serine protease